jgi:hypothetical protein
LSGDVYTFDQQSFVLIDGEFGMIAGQGAFRQKPGRFYFEICPKKEKKKRHFYNPYNSFKEGIAEF